MSRIGKLPIVVPQGGKASLKDGVVLVEGPMGKLEYRPRQGIHVSMDGSALTIVPSEKDSNRQSAQMRADWGTTRAHLNNMLVGVTKGWKRSLELFGVGFNAKAQGQKLTLSVGFSHDVSFEIPKAIKCTIGKNTIDLESCDKELLGTFAAKIRKVQPPEPYLGKGIKYSDEKVRRKAGKTGKK